MLELIINKNKDIETICLAENGKLIEKYQNDKNAKKSRLEGNIYVGRVADIVPGMQAAFIDYGEEKKGFIHYKDAIPQVDVKQGEKNENIDTDIRKILKQDDKILIQIKKDSNDKKGAKVSKHISLPSKYIVYMPDTKILTISQKIDNKEKAKKLVEIATKNVTPNNGLVIRTAAKDATEEEIVKDIKKCEKKWKEIKQSFEKSKSAKLIYESQSIEEKIIIDLKLDKIITNSKEKYDKIKKILEDEEINNVDLKMEKNENLLERYDLQKQIDKSRERKVWLNCGGFITIDRTEALTAIDVNTGKFTGNKDLETTIFKVNKEATTEIAKQLRLRDIGGIVVIDYIDMQSEENKMKIQQLLIDELKLDRAKTQVEGFTKLNLLEMTRKHICSHLDEE